MHKMKRKSVRAVVIILMMVIGLPLLVKAGESGLRPNILFIPVDDLRIDLGCYGNEQVITPNIDRLASEGTLFERAYCQVPVCGASRASFLTGLYPTADRFVTYYSKAEEDAPGVVDLPGWFKENGYTTISNGKVYHHASDNRTSWDEVHKPKDFRVYLLPENQGLEFKDQVSYEAADVEDTGYPGGQLAEKIMGDLRRAKESGTPFFITAGFTKPHLPFNAPKKYWDMYDRAELELADNDYVPKGAPSEAIHNWGELRGYGDIPDEGPLPEGMNRILTHGYYASTTYTDAMIGKVLDELDRLEMRDNTIIILFGDHGWQLGEHSLWCKHSLFQTSMQAPMIISAPGMPAGLQTKALVEFVDIYPTLCDLAGIPLPDHLQGKSVKPVMLDQEIAFKEAAFARYHGGEVVKTDRFAYAEWKSGGRMLYDHQKDPDENINIVDNPEYRSVVEKLSGLLKAHREKVGQDDRSREASEPVGGNSAPKWKRNTFKLKDPVVGQDYRSHVNWAASDKDGDSLTYELVAGPEWLRMTNNKYGRLEGVPGDAGEVVIVVSASDGVNAPVEANVILNVQGGH
jgi:arylsulfatase A-like enzyme